MAPWILPAIGGGLQALGIGASIWGANKQADSSMKIARFQAQANERYLDKMLEYNSPAAQMKRFADAGLNPHLIYGQGSPGNQSQPLQYPNIEPKNYGRIADAIARSAELVPMMNQSRLIDSQVQATNAKTRQTTVLTELNKLQARVIAKNPLLDDEGFKATIDALKATAEQKFSESEIAKQRADFMTGKFFGDMSLFGPGVQKMQRELDLLEQRFRLSQLDEKLKAEVLKSKEFQNTLLEIQKKWMADGEINPQHILQFVQLLLMKAL